MLRARAEAESAKAKESARKALRAAEEERKAKKDLQALVKEKNKELEKMRRIKSHIETDLRPKDTLP